MFLQTTEALRRRSLKAFNTPTGRGYSQIGLCWQDNFEISTIISRWAELESHEVGTTLTQHMNNNSKPCGGTTIALTFPTPQLVERKTAEERQRSVSLTERDEERRCSRVEKLW